MSYSATPSTLPKEYTVAIKGILSLFIVGTHLCATCAPGEALRSIGRVGLGKGSGDWLSPSSFSLFWLICSRLLPKGSIPLHGGHWERDS